VKGPDDARTRLERCYREFGFRVHRRALGITGREEDACDVTQAVFIRLATHLGTLRDGHGISSWIYVVTTREALQLLRARKRRRRREGRYAEVTPQTQPGPEARTAAAEQVLRLVTVAPDEQLEAALLYFVDQLGQDEIAQLLRVSRRTVIRRINAFRRTAQEQEQRGATVMGGS
jgi:RNA polymerase sigma-70 factor, ECF subfamily